jgi:hypothetical protein
LIAAYSDFSNVPMAIDFLRISASSYAATAITFSPAQSPFASSRRKPAALSGAAFPWVANFSINWFMAFLSVPMCFREQHHTDSGTPLFWLRLRRAVVKSPVLTLANCQLLIANCSGPSASFCVNLRQPLFPLFLCALCALCG